MNNTVTFRAFGRKPLTGSVKNPNARLGDVAPRIAAHMGLGGTFECLNKASEAIDPQTRLVDLPDGEITLSPDLTPA